jgi:hypothetical protein
MWPAAIAYVLASDEQRNAVNRDRHTRRVVHERHPRTRRSPRSDL